MSQYEEINRRDKKISELEGKVKQLEKYIELIPGNKDEKLPILQQAIIEYITKNPGTSKQKVIDKLTLEGKGSRVTILKDIKILIENGLVASRKVKENSPNYNLYINDNYYKDLIDVHNEFEKLFIEIIEKLKPQIFTDEFLLNFNNEQPSQTQIIILHIMYNIYSHFMAMVILHAIFNWPEIIKDEEKRNKLNTILFSKMQKLHQVIYDSFKYESNKLQISLGIPVLANTILSWFKLNPSNLKSSIEIVKEYNVSSQMEKLLEIVWKVSYPFLPFARPLFEKDGYTESQEIKWSKQKWRPINWKEAVKYHEKGFLDSELNSLIIKAGEMLTLGKTAEALQYYEHVLSIDPENLYALNDKGYLFNKLGRYYEALECLDKVLSIDPTNVNALLNKGNSLGYLNRHNEAIDFYDQVLKIEPNNFNALNNKGHELLLLNNVKESQQYLEMAFKIEPENLLVLYNKGLLYKKKGDYKEALKWFDKLLYLNPEHIDGLLKKGDILLTTGQEQEPALIFQHVLKLDPKNIGALNGMGIYLMKHSTIEDGFEEVIQYFDKAFEINPEHFETLNNKAGCILRFRKTDKDIDEAIQYFDKALTIRPNEIGVLLNLGIAYNLRRKYDEAIKYFDKILKNLPNDTTALLFKAETLLDMMKYNEAIKYFEKVLSLDLSNDQAKEGIRKAKERLKK